MASNAVWTGLVLALLAWSAFTDVTRREIPNAACVLIALCAFFSFAAHGLPAHGLGWTNSLAVLAIGFVISALIPLIGAGDVKLLAALALWFPGPAFCDLLFLTALMGGVLALAVLALNCVRREKIRDLPYGAAIGCAAAVMLSL